MQTPPCLASAEIEAVTDLYRAALAGLPPPLIELAWSLLPRISPPRWAVEWSLPRWVGDAVGLTPEVSRRLALGNALGLTYVRIQDDLLDGETAGADPAAWRLLSKAVYGRWLALYAELLGCCPTFWDELATCLTEWIEATWRSLYPSARRFQDFDANDWRCLGQRGAPLKICLAAACLLADRTERLPALTAGVEELLTASVLLDQAVDWERDLEAGRHNVFIAYASALPQTAEPRADVRQAVLATLQVGAGVTPYYRLIRDRLANARRQLVAAECPDLERYVVWLQQTAEAHRRRSVRASRLSLRQAVQEVLRLSAASPDRRPSIPQHGKELNDGISGSTRPHHRQGSPRYGFPPVAI
jgi:hypothetical protein